MERNTSKHDLCIYFLKIIQFHSLLNDCYGFKKLQEVICNLSNTLTTLSTGLHEIIAVTTDGRQIKVTNTVKCLNTFWDCSSFTYERCIFRIHICYVIKFFFYRLHVQVWKDYTVFYRL